MRTLVLVLDKQITVSVVVRYAVLTTNLILSFAAKLERIGLQGVVMLQAGHLLQSRYKLQECLAQNAGRQTWIAVDQSVSSEEKVIVKFLAFSPEMQWEDFKLFEREAQVLKNLSHPRIPKYRDYFSVDKQVGSGLYWFALVQDYIPGKSLQNLLDTGKHFTEKKCDR